MGHSHLGAIKFCYINGKPFGKFDDIELEFIDLHGVASFEYYHSSPEELGAPLREAFEMVEVARGGPPAAVFMLVGGSVQHSISMLNHEWPIDVIVPWEPRAPLTEGATLIPFRMLEKLLIEQSSWKFNLLTLSAKHFSCPKYFFQAPPPIASEDHLRKYPGPQFQPLVEERGFSPIAFRRKIAEMHTRLYMARCEAAGITFLAPPTKGLDDDGCLALEAAAPDSIHASVVYGEYLIDQIRAIRNQAAEAAA